MANTCESGAIEMRLIVWIHPTDGWHARVVMADATEHEFASPFELVRHVAWPMTFANIERRKGLR